MGDPTEAPSAEEPSLINDRLASEEASEPDPQDTSDRRMALLALEEERQRLSLSKLHWHVTAAGIPTGVGHLKTLEKAVRDHRRTIELLEELLEHGLPGPSGTGLVIAFPTPDESGDAS